MSPDHGLLLPLAAALTDRIAFGDLSTWITALAAVATAATAVIAAVTALRTYARGRDDRRREIDQARRSQASQVSVWTHSGGMVTLKNASTAPVYGIIATCVNLNTSDPDGREEVPQGQMTRRVGLAVLPPGEGTEMPIPDWGGGTPGRREGYELAFTDSSGHHCLRSARGRLAEIREPALVYYGFHPPYPF